MKVGIIAIAKNEDLYMEELIDWHLGLGFDTIIIGLNDDEFKPLISNPQVIYEDYSGVQGVQVKAYRKLYRKYQKDFDWLLFIDIDEFVMLEKGTIQDFLQDFDCDEVRISCKHFTDGDALDTDGDYRVMARFTEPMRVDEDRFVKSFINTRVDIRHRMIYGHGIYDEDIKAMDALGNPCDSVGHRLKYVVHERCWLNHYPTKTIGEYIRQKWRRGGANNNPGRYSNWDKYFFRTNRRTQEKIDYANKIIKEIDK
jgi:hypothetical protein